jgi:mycothiol synthase
VTVPSPIIVPAADLPSIRRRVEQIDGAADAVDGHPSLSDAVWRDFDRATPGSVGVMLDDDAYAHVGRADNASDQDWLLAIVVAPRARATAARDVSLRAAIAHIASRGGGRAGLWVLGATPDDDRALDPIGFRPDRELWEMRVALPIGQRPKLPAGVAVRTFEAGRDEHAFLAVNNRAFAGHAEQGGWTAETLARRIGERWFDPTLFLLAFDELGLSGFNWMKMHNPTLGEIYVIGVDPRAHGSGLGRALAIAGLDAVAERGATVGMLFVAAENTPARRLYESLGFKVVRVDRAYTIEVAPA